MPARSPLPASALVRFGAPWSVTSRWVTRGIGFPRFRLELGLFVPVPRGLFPAAVSPAVRQGRKSSYELAVLFRAPRTTTGSVCLRPVLRLPGLRTERLSWGLRPRRGFNRRHPQIRQAPSPPLWSVLGVSHALNGFRHHRPCGFVSPRCHVQGSRPSGVHPSRGAAPGFPDPCPPAVGRPNLCSCPQADSNALDFRALLPARVRWLRKR